MDTHTNTHAHMHLHKRIHKHIPTHTCTHNPVTSSLIQLLCNRFDPSNFLFHNVASTYMAVEDIVMTPAPPGGGSQPAAGAQPPPAGAQPPRRRRSRSVRRAQREAPIVHQEQDDAQRTFVNRWRTSYITHWQGRRLVEWVCDSCTTADGVVTERWRWHYIE